jgi:hypothetical protein
LLKTLIKIRLYGFRQVKLKLGGGDDRRFGETHPWNAYGEPKLANVKPQRSGKKL